MIIRISGLIEEENDVKYLIISDTNKNSEALKKYNEVFHGIRDCIKKKQIIVKENMTKIL